MNSSAELFCRENFEVIAALLQRGEVCILPTDTIPGFSAPISSAVSIAKIKNRTPQKPFLLLFPDFFSAERAVDFSPLARFFFAHFPDPITLVLPRKKGAFPDFFPEEDFLAIRIPRLPTLVKFLHFFGSPICSTSVNISGERVLTETSEIKKIFPQIPFFRGKKKPSKSPSGIVKIEGEQIMILRGERSFCNTIREMQLNFSKTKNHHDLLLEKGKFWER